MDASSALVPGFLVGAVTVTLLAWTYIRRNTVEAYLHNIPGPPSSSFLIGNIEDLFNRHASKFHNDIASKYGPIVRLTGLLGSPMLYVYDPKALHSVIVKDQNVYEQSPDFISVNAAVFGLGIAGVVGKHHRKQRKMLNPVFSANQMRFMVPIFYDVSKKLREAITTRVRDGPSEVDMLQWMGRAALEFFSQCGLGHSFDPLTEDRVEPYGEAAKAFVPALLDLGVLRLLCRYVYKLGPAYLRRTVVNWMPFASVQKMKQVSNTLYDISAEIFAEKKLAIQQGEAALQRRIGEGKDIMSTLMKANMAAVEEDRLPESELIAQMSMLVFAAMDTSSNTLARILHILAERPDVQRRLREEIMAAQKGEDLSYNELMQLPFLDAICRETLRLYPMATFISRETNKDIVMPVSEPIRGRDGRLMGEVTVPRGTTILVGILGWNCSKAVWGEDALEWKPERWLSPLPKTVTESQIPSVYSHIMTFTGGSRSCVGFKFAEVEIKAVLATLLPAFVFEMSKPIYWNMAGVNYATVGEVSNKAELPLKVSLYNPAGKA